MTRHFRDDIELPELNRDDYYSHHYQEIRSLRRRPKVLPGDALVTTCYYDTRGYTNTTLGGFSISDEMCVRFIFMSDILHPTEYGNNLTLYYIQVCELHPIFPRNKSRGLQKLCFGKNTRRILRLHARV